MKVSVVFCFIAAVAQATGASIFPEKIANVVKQSASISSRIVGGNVAAAGQFPYAVGLHMLGRERNGWCTGTILSSTWILTAAHCVDYAATARAIFTTWDSETNADKSFGISSSKIIIHEDWEPIQRENDIALIELSEKIEFTESIWLARLPTRSQASASFAGYSGIVAGWGLDSDYATEISSVLRWTSNPIITNEECNDIWYGNIVDEKICLSGQNGRSSCREDGGSPLVVIGESYWPTLVGIESWRNSAKCTAGLPGVYTRVGSHLDWIQLKTAGDVVVRD